MCVLVPLFDSKFKIIKIRNSFVSIILPLVDELYGLPLSTLLDYRVYKP